VKGLKSSYLLYFQPTLAAPILLSECPVCYVMNDIIIEIR